MSSAILYLAIVAIWACVLIPRWLRRDSAPGAVNANADGQAPVSDGTAAPGAVVADTGLAGLAGLASLAGLTGIMNETPVLPGNADDEAPRPLPAPLSAEESRRRMLKARRRLLGMLAALEAAAIALAVIGLAALWVVIPPTIMLAGYLLLLREAAHADAEHAQLAAEAAAARAQTLARSRPGGRTRATQHPTPAEGTPLAATAAAAAAAAVAAELAARFAAAPVAADYEDSGRDFAPGLAGKYTPANADPDLSDEDYYGYEAPRLRAVGD